MPELSAAQVIEAFHLGFFQVLPTRLEPARYVLKGGANLRYFFGSDRYSEDVDLDMVDVEPSALAHKVDTVLESTALGLLFRRSGLAIDEFTKPKQTATTRRWKIAVEAPGHSQRIRTKIEFSNRNGDDRRILEAVPRRIVAPFAVRAPTVQHYTAEAAVEQKVRALAGRSQTQARDLFDLDLLLRQQSVEAGALKREVLADAADRALELPFDAFQAQVMPFLEPAVASLYDADAWERMQLEVAERLREEG